MFGFGKLKRDYALISGKGHGGHGWVFPEGIREMVAIMEDTGNYKDSVATAAIHEKRIEVLLAYSCAFERENPQIDTSKMSPYEWAMTVFIIFHGHAHDRRGHHDAVGAAATYAGRHNEIDAFDRSERMASHLLTSRQARPPSNVTDIA